jgi:hypothetical protein
MMCRELDIIPFDINVRIEDESAFVQNSGVTSGVISTVGEQDVPWKKRYGTLLGYDYMLCDVLNTSTI